MLARAEANLDSGVATGAICSTRVAMDWAFTPRESSCWVAQENMVFRGFPLERVWTVGEERERRERGERREEAEERTSTRTSTITGSLGGGEEGQRAEERRENGG